MKPQAIRWGDIEHISKPLSKIMNDLHRDTVREINHKLNGHRGRIIPSSGKRGGSRAA